MEVSTSRWHNRNYPKRGETVSIPVRDLGFDPDTVTYLGEFNGSGFRWIGKYKDMPEKYLDQIVVEMYERTIEYTGQVILIDVGRKKKAGGNNGQYWNWNEVDKTVKPWPMDHDISTDGAEMLLMAIIKDSARVYRNDIERALKKSNYKTEKGIRNIIRRVRGLDEKVIELMAGTSRGEYILQRIEDEAVIRAMHPDWDSVPYEKRRSYMDQELKRIRKQRVKSEEQGHYATIKGRSVKKSDTL